MTVLQFLRRLLQRRVASPQELIKMKLRMLEAKKRVVDKALEGAERSADVSEECQRLDREASRLEAKLRRALRSAAERYQVDPWLLKGEHSHYWRCPHCGTRLEKPSFDMMEQLLGAGGKLSGTATCPQCHGQSSQAEVYGGRFDM